MDQLYCTAAMNRSRGTTAATSWVVLLLVGVGHAAAPMGSPPPVSDGNPLPAPVAVVAPIQQDAIPAPGEQPALPPAPPATPSVVRIEPIGPLKLESGNSPPWWSYWAPVVGPVISGLLAFAGAWLRLRIAQGNTLRAVEAAQRTNEASIWHKANETELRDLQAKLDGFYGPFTQMSQANHFMAQELRARQPNHSEYRLLVQVFDKQWLDSLSIGDHEIVEQICAKAAELEKFIADKTGIVDLKLLPYLARATAHFRILHLAHSRELGAGPTHFKRYIYPQQLDGVWDLEMIRLRSRCDQLRARPGMPPNPIPPLEIPANLRLPPWPNPERT